MPDGKSMAKASRGCGIHHQNLPMHNEALPPLDYSLSNWTQISTLCLPWCLMASLWQKPREMWDPPPESSQHHEALPPLDPSLDTNFPSLPAMMPDGKSMAKASRDVGSTTRIFSAQLGTATTRPFTEQLDRNFNVSVCHDAWWQVDGKSFARCVLAHGSSRLAMKSFLSSKHVSATPKIKSCSKPIHGSSTYYANIAAWWRLVNSFWQLVGPPVLYSDVCSVTFTASVVMLQATAGARTWGHGPESLQEGLSIFGFWRIAKENPITSCQLFESIWNRVKIQAQWNYGTLSRDAKGCKGNHNCFWCLSNSLTNWTTQISRVSQIAVDHL